MNDITKKMKRILILLSFALISSASFSQSVKKINMKELLHYIDTSSVPLVVNFWATWCGPCIREIPWFEKNITALPGKPVRLILVSLDFPDEYPAGITDFAKKNGYISAIYWMSETDTEVYTKQVDKSWDGSIPVTWMINNKKKYRKFYKQQLPEPRLQLELQNLMN